MTAADATEDPAGGWERLHPLTPLLRGGRFVLVLLAVVGQQGLRSASTEVLLLTFGIGTPLAVLVGYVAWRSVRYRVTPTELQVESGVLTRRSRRVPLARVQSVDVVRPLLARVLGLAELRLEVVGGGGGAEAPLSYLSEDDARALRTRLLQLASGRPEAGEQAPAPVEQVLVVVPPGPLVGSVLLGPPAVLAVALLLVLLVVAVVDVRLVAGVAVGALPLLFASGSFAVRRVLAEYGFSVAETPDGLRLRQGLLEKRSSTIPPGRVQTVRVREPLLWRPFGWVRVEVDVAGYSGGGSAEQQASSGALLPVAPRELAERLVARVLGGDLPPADVPAPAAARWRAPLSHRRLAVGLDDTHLVSTYGVVTTTTDVVPLAKVQSLRLTVGPLQRRLGLASLHADTAGRRLPGAVAPAPGRGRGPAPAGRPRRTQQGRPRAVASGDPQHRPGGPVQLAGTAALVTGGASGLGLAAATELVAAGASVVLADLPGSPGAQAASRLGGAAVFVADRRHGRGVRAAGRRPRRPARTAARRRELRRRRDARPRARQGRTAPLDAFVSVVTVNLVGTFNVIRLAAAAMAETDPVDGERGVLVNTASAAAYDGQIGQAAYSASKGGVVGLTLPVARDLADKLIRVMTIAPGLFDTPMLQGLPEPARQSLAQQVPMPSRLGDPAEYAALVRHVVREPDAQRRGHPAGRRDPDGAPLAVEQRLEVGAELLHGGGARRRHVAEAEEAVDQPVVAARHHRHAGRLERRGVRLALVAQRVVLRRRDHRGRDAGEVGRGSTEARGSSRCAASAR